MVPHRSGPGRSSLWLRLEAEGVYSRNEIADLYRISRSTVDVIVWKARKAAEGSGNWSKT
jgi:hypothetical protein